jgi:hypothetical protein
MMRHATTCLTVSAAYCCCRTFAAGSADGIWNFGALIEDMRRYARIIGTGSYLPPRRLTNNDLAAELAQRGLETSDEWIVERTGIRARHFAEPDVTSSDLALRPAARPSRPQASRLRTSI